MLRFPSGRPASAAVWPLLALLLWLGGCQTATLLPVAEFSTQQHVPESITLVTWNAQKGENASFRADVARLLAQHQPDFLLMQEATDDLLKGGGIGGHFAGSWRYPLPGGETIGLMTLSKVSPAQLTPLPTKHREFFITAPKLSLATEYALADGRTLLLVNVHILAFERGPNKAVADQLRGLQAVMMAHRGPIIMAGDLNTWSDQRLLMLARLAEELGLTEVQGFPEGRRTGGIGWRWADKLYGVREDMPLDRVFQRGFHARKAQVLPYRSSDHAALLVRLELQKPAPSSVAVALSPR